MTEGISLVQVAFKIAPLVISFGGKEIIRRLTDNSPTSKAIATTSDTFGEVEGLHGFLTAWCLSEDFSDLFDKLHEGDRLLTDVEIATKFIDVTEFFMAEDTNAVAEDILHEFMRNLEHELYGSDEGIAFLANRMELHGQEVTDRLGALSVQQTEIQDSLKQMASAFIPEDIKSSPLGQELILSGRIDEARRLIHEGQARSAKTHLLEIRDDAEKLTTSPELRFRIATNLGACALALDALEEAKSEFQGALRLQPSDPKALRNAGVAYLLDEQWEGALELGRQATEADPEKKEGIDVQLESLFRLEMLDQLDEFLYENSWIESDLAYPLVLARIEAERGRHDKAEKLITHSLENASDSDVGLKHALLGQIISAPIRRQLSIDPPFPWKIPPDVTSRLQEAESHLGTAIKLLRDRQDRGRLNDALVNRAGVRGMLGDYTGGLEDCDRVLRDDPQDAVAIRNKGILLFHLERTAEAIGYLEQLQTSDDWPSVALMVASGYDEIGMPINAVDTIKPFWKPETGDHHQLLIAHFLLRAYHGLDDEEHIEEITAQIKKRWPNDPEALAILAQQRLREGAVDESIELMREGLNYSQGNQRDRIALQLAETLYKERKYPEAAEVYRLIVNTSENNSIFRGYLISLYNAGVYGEALKLAREMRQGGEPIPIVSEIEASILEYIGDMESAEGLWLGLSLVRPDKADYVVNTAMAQFRQGHREKAKETIQSIPYNAVKDDPEALVILARASSILDPEDDVLPLIYRARRIGYGSPATHLAYLQFFLDSEKKGAFDLAPTEVGVDCTVHLALNDEKRTHTILDEVSLDPARGELSPNDPLASRLIGLKEGDRITIQRPYENLVYEVTNVQSKYVYAYQQTLADFPTMFPSHLGIQRMTIKDDDFSTLLRSVDERHEFVSGVVTHYRRKVFTLGAVARLTGNNQIEVWQSLCSKPGERFLVASGTGDERELERSNIKTAQSLVMDLTSLLTLRLLGLFDVIVKRFKNILVAQAVLDEINEAIVNGFSGAQPSAVLSKEGDQYMSQELTPEDFERGKRFLEEVREFVEAKANVIPTTGMLTIGHDEAEKYKEVIGISAFASLVACRDNNSVLYSDDLTLRVLARAEDRLGRIEGVSILTVLWELREEGLLSNDEYYDALKLLILSNYNFVSLDVDALMWVFQQSGCRSTPDVLKVFGTLKGPDCNESSAAIVAANLTRKAWLELNLFHEKVAILDLLLEALTTGRIEDQVINSFKQLLSVRFILMPSALDLIIEHIGNWQRQNLTIGGSLLWLPGQAP